MHVLLKTVFVSLLLTLPTHAFAQTIVRVDSFPQNLQLYQRGSNNLAQVSVTGSAPTAYVQLSLSVLRSGAPYFYQKQPLTITGTPGSFSFSPSLRAEAVEYTFLLYAFTSPADSVLVSRSDRIVCGDVLILHGQSNVLALHELDLYAVDDRLLRNFTYPYLSTDIPGQVVWSTAKVPFGSVGGIGLWLQKLILDQYGIPTCVIDGGVGGTPIKDLSARDPADHASLNTYYGLLLYRVRRAGLANKARIIIYKQGEADAGFNTDHYDTALRTLTDQFEEDYPAVKKIYVSQINIIADPEPRAGQVRDAQRRARQQAPLIETIATVGSSFYDGVHYLRPGNQQIATELFRQIARDFYGSADTVQINSPNIKTARYNTRRDTITLTFEAGMRMVWPIDTVIYDPVTSLPYTRRMVDFIYLDGQAGAVSSGSACANQVILALNGPAIAQTITYLPPYFSDTHSPFYNGVHLKNERGMRAFSFDTFPLTTPDTPKRTQTIDFVTESARIYSDAPVTLTAGASSALPVTFMVVSGPAVRLNSHQLRLTGTGVVTVKAVQSGDEQYLPATTVVQSLTISRGTQQIGDLLQTTRTGQVQINISATASSGLPVAYSLVSGPAALQGSALTMSDFGLATLQLSQAGDDRYLPATVIRTICLNPVKLTISTDPASDLILVSSSPFRNQWFFNGDTLRGATSQQLTITQAGTYGVKVTNPVAVCNSNTADQSALRQVIVLGTDPVPRILGLRIQPNPATDQVRISIESASAQTPVLQLIDGSGRLISDQFSLTPVANGFEATLSVRVLKSGFYLLRATTANGPVASRLLVRP